MLTNDDLKEILIELYFVWSFCTVAHAKKQLDYTIRLGQIDELIEKVRNELKGELT